MKPVATAAAEADGGVASPCVEVCRMNPHTGYCEGCCRTLDEIAQWTAYSGAEKRAVLARLPGRGSRK